jgi:hypothetical protein
LQVIPDVQPKRHKQVDDERRSKRDKGEINKIQPDPGGIDPHPLAKLLAYAESGFFKEMSIAF